LWGPGNVLDYLSVTWECCDCESAALAVCVSV